MDVIGLLSDPHIWGALVSLTALEIVLGIDNVVFISILVSRLPEQQAKKARQIGLALALIFRVALLFVLSWIMGLTSLWWPSARQLSPGAIFSSLRRPVPDSQGYS